MNSWAAAIAEFLAAPKHKARAFAPEERRERRYFVGLAAERAREIGLAGEGRKVRVAGVAPHVGHPSVRLRGSRRGRQHALGGQLGSAPARHGRKEGKPAQVS